METAVVFALVLATCSLAAGSAMARRGEPFRLWAALGLVMGPMVIPFARQHLRDRAIEASLVHASIAGRTGEPPSLN